MSAVVIDSGVDQGAVSHYGDPFREARELAAGRALVHLASTAVITVSGTSRMEWLHLFLSQACDGSAPGDSFDALILTPNGHIEFGIHVVDDGDTAWLLTDRGNKDALLAYLTMMVFTYDVKIADRTEDHAVLAGVGEPVHVESAVAVWRAGASFSTADPSLDKYVPQRPAVWPAFELVVPSASVDEMLAEHGAAGMWAWESLRVGAGVPRVAVDADHRSLPHELGLIGEAVHLRKGCYRGQEAVARTYNLGKPPRRLVLLHLDGSGEDLPAVGAEIRLVGVDVPAAAGGAQDAGHDSEGSSNPAVVGAVGTVVRHYELGPIALAVVKRSVPIDATLSIDSGKFTATQEAIVVVPDEVSPVAQFRREQRANMSPLKDDRTGSSSASTP